MKQLCSTAVVLGLVAGCSGASGPGAATAGEPGTPPDAFMAYVVRVVDGDTFIARRSGRDVRVRLLGVDAPESVKPDAPVDCYGPAASRVLRRLLPPGTRVRAAYEDGGRHDHYGRDLWDVWLPDGRFLQAVLVDRGAARARAYPPQVEHADQLADRQRAAQRSGAGLWSACSHA